MPTKSKKAKPSAAKPAAKPVRRSAAPTPTKAKTAAAPASASAPPPSPPEPKTPLKAKSAAPALAASPSRVPHHTIFIDVENASHEEELWRALDGLAIDRTKAPTQLLAVGNWRAVGQRLARRLAATGAQLVHSAPVTGVRDWSDLWIAVSAGIRLAQAQPGDRLDIISDDRAFDAVGDAAANLGVIFRRLSSSGRQRAAAPEAAAPTEKAPSRRRRGRRRSGAPTPSPAPTHTARAHAHSPAQAPEEPHGATREQMVGVITRLSGGDSKRWVNLDVLENALKAEGFSRPPGSQRLVTRLRKLDDIEVSPHGAVRLREATHR